MYTCNVYLNVSIVQGRINAYKQYIFYENFIAYYKHVQIYDE